MGEFQKARIKLTLWYILINLALLAIFSLAALNAEKRAFSSIQASLSDPNQRPRLTNFLATRISGFEDNFLQRLLTFDLLLLLLSSIASYFLSGRTLKPIASMIKHQQEFAADASHELRTPLTTIKLEVESLKRNTKLKQTHHQLLLSIDEEVSRMSAIVDGLLTLVRADRISRQSNKITFDLNQITSEAFKALSSQAKSHNLAYTLDTPGPVIIFGDPTQLKQLAIILIDNAIKYTPKGGKVNVLLKHSGHFSTLSVTDSGVGISKEDLPHIFDRFYRGKTSSLQKGSGLGLTIAKKIVEYHNGKITASSNDDQGSTFTVTLTN